MALLRFPFWIVTQHECLLPLPVPAPEESGFVATFVTAQEATEFMLNRKATKWELRLISRGDVPLVVEQFERLGVIGFWQKRDDRAVTATLDEIRNRCRR
jgi:hypothetical protein